MKIFRFSILIIMSLASYLLYSYLPNQIPMHWNLYGQIDDYMNKSMAVVFFPTITAGLLILFEYLPNLDPKKSKYRLFAHEWEILKTVFALFFAYLQFIIFYITLSHVPFLPLMFAGLGIFFILLGNYLSKVRQNYFLGVRTPWTLTSEDNWNKTHRYASWSFVIAGLITLISSFVSTKFPVLVFVSLIAAGILPILYSYLLYKNQTQLMKFFYLGLIILTFILIRSSSPEDNWICQDGAWIQHGRPIIPQPITACP